MKHASDAASSPPLTLRGLRILATAAPELPADQRLPGMTVPVDIHLHSGYVADMAPATGIHNAGDWDAEGLLALPGFVNCHTHSHETLHRGRYPKLPLEVWMHFLRPPTATHLSPEDVYARTVLTAIDAVNGGATTVVDDVAIPGLDNELLSAVHRAYEDVGIRAFIGPSLLDRRYYEAVPFLEEEMPDDLRSWLEHQVPVPDAEASLALIDRLLAAFDPQEQLVTYVATPSAPQRCSDAFLRAVSDLARRHRRPLLTHVQETRLQAATAPLLHGASAVAHLDELGVLGATTTLIHGVWLSGDDIARISRSGTTVQHNPVSNLRLGSGVAPVRPLLDAGVNVSLGTDGAGSCLSISVQDSARTAGLLSTLRGDTDDWIDSPELFRMATTAGATALGQGDRLGSLGPGSAADLVCYQMDSVALTPLNDPLRQLLYSVRPPLDTAIVAGRPLLRGGAWQTVDERQALAAARAAHARILPAIEEADRLVAKWLAPLYGRVLARSKAVSLPSKTLTARLPEAPEV